MPQALSQSDAFGPGGDFNVPFIRDVGEESIRIERISFESLFVTVYNKRGAKSQANAWKIRRKFHFEAKVCRCEKGGTVLIDEPLVIKLQWGTF